MGRCSSDCNDDACEADGCSKEEVKETDEERAKREAETHAAWMKKHYNGKIPLEYQ